MKTLATILLLITALCSIGCPDNKPKPGASSPSAEPQTGDKSGSTDKSGAPKEE